MKIKRFVIAALCAVLLTACAFDEEEMAEAWSACEAATGNPSGEKVTGKIYEIDSIDGADPFFNIGDSAEDTYGGQKYTDDRLGDLYYLENFTKDLTKATSVLCIKVKTKYYDSCNYPSDQKVEFTRKYYATEAQLTLLAWPSKELIAQTILGNLEGGDVKCPVSILHDSDVKVENVYGAIDMDGWLEQYVIPGE